MIDIPAQQLGMALHELARERDLQLVYRSELVRGVNSPGAMGVLTFDAAIEQLLEGTGLAYHFIDDKTLTVVPLAAAAAEGAVRLNDLPDYDRIFLLEEVVITAQKVAAVASNTPLALGVYSGRMLREQGIRNVADLQNNEPAMQVGQTPAGVNLTIRGVTTTDNTSKGDQGIAFNIDGVPVGRPRQMGLALFDLERIEVLRGPQGTLYGKSSTGGAINVVTNKPRNAFDAAVTLEVGDLHARRGELMVNVPVGNGLALRAAASFNVRDGYLKPVLGGNQAARAAALNDENNFTGRLSGLWNFGHGASLLVTGTVGQVAGAGASPAIIAIESGSDGQNYAALRNGPDARNVFFNPFRADIDQNIHNISGELNVDLGLVRLTYNGARFQLTARDLSSSSSAPSGRANSYGWTDYYGTYDTQSHELRLTNPYPQRVEWVAGLNQYDEHIYENDHSWNVPIVNPVLPASINATGILANTDHRSFGVFGQAHIHIRNALKITLGARRSSDSVRRRGTFASGAGPAPGTPWSDPTGRPCTAPDVCVGTRNDGDQSADKFTYRVGADYLLNSKQLLYASAATGYKAGGFNDFDAVSHNPAPYLPEQLTAYEAGYKGQIRPDLQLNGSAFYYDYERDQISSAVLINGIGVLFTRAVPAVVYGLESDLHYRINTRNQLDLSLSLENSRYAHFQAGFQQNVDWTGHRLDKTPSLAATLSVAHRWPIEAGGNVEARLNSRYSSGYLVSDFVAAEHYTQRAFVRSDISVAYNSNSSRISLQAFIRNIEDRQQLLNAPQNVDVAVPGSANAAVSEPRMLGLRASLHY